MAGLNSADFLIIGKAGQVGSAFTELLPGATFIDYPEIDLTKPKEAESIISKHNPKVIINAAAYTAVDKAEEEKDFAFKINGESPGLIARYCAQKGIIFIHYSTDYVFPGSGEKPWKEDDKTGPLNIYGESKLAGDEAVVKAGGKYLIFRTSWVYDHQGKNFLKTMLRVGKEREQLKIVNDQTGAPTYALHIAKYTLEALNKATSSGKFPNGIYNLCNSQFTTWYGFATKIFELAGKKGMKLKVKEVLPINSSEYPTPAKRPHNSRLDLTKLRNTFGIDMPSWDTALKSCMERINENN